MLNSVFHVRPSIPVQKWTNYSKITAPALGPSINCARMFNSSKKVVKSIPEEYFEIGNFRCKS